MAQTAMARPLHARLEMVRLVMAQPAMAWTAMGRCIVCGTNGFAVPGCRGGCSGTRGGGFWHAQIAISRFHAIYWTILLMGLT